VSSSSTPPLPSAKFPTQLEESYAALKWVAAHAGEFGADGNRIAIAGNSVGGNMTAALTLMAKDRKGPKVAYQVLLIPATDASVDTIPATNLLRAASCRAPS
jgi:acetyl esterase/lipase